MNEVAAAEVAAVATGAEIAVVVTKHDVVSVADIKKSSYVFDCTGSIPGVDGI